MHPIAYHRNISSTIKIHNLKANLSLKLRFKSLAIAVRAAVLSSTVNALQTIASVDQHALAVIVIIQLVSTPFASKPSNKS